MGTDGDLKLYGRMIDVQEPALRSAYRAAIKARIDWEPDEPEFHLFSLDVEVGRLHDLRRRAPRAGVGATGSGLRQTPARVSPQPTFVSGA